MSETNLSFCASGEVMQRLKFRLRLKLTIDKRSGLTIACFTLPFIIKAAAIALIAAVTPQRGWKGRPAEGFSGGALRKAAVRGV